VKWLSNGKIESALSVEINKKIGPKSAEIIPDDANVLSFNESGKRDSKHLGLKAESDLLGVVETAGRNLMGTPFFEPSSPLRYNDLAFPIYEEFVERVTKRFRKIVDGKSWLAISHALNDSDNAIKTQRFQSLDDLSQASFLNELRDEVNKLLEPVVLRDAHFKAVLTGVSNTTTNADLIDPVSKVIHEAIDERLG
jgi:hypothetical protein